MMLTSSCASFLNGRYQKVTITTPSEDSKVYVNNELQGTGKVIVAKMKRNLGVKQIRIDREGYKPIYKVHYQGPKSGLYAISWVPFAVLLMIPPVSDNGPKAYNYPRKVTIDDNMLQLKKRTENEKYVYLRNTAFDVKKEDVKFRIIKTRNYKRNLDRYKDRKIETEALKYDNTEFTEKVQEILKKSNYVDTTNTVFKTNTNSMYISSKINKIGYDCVFQFRGGVEQYFYVSNIEIEWEMFDSYNQSKYKKTLKAKSGEFSPNFYTSNNVLRESIDDAIRTSFYNFMEEPEVVKLIDHKGVKEDIEQTIKISRPAAISNLENAMDATVTVKVKDGHGSGCIISNDGYIVTNFHVVANTDKITVLTKDGKEYSAKLVRKNQNSDLALIKIETSINSAFTLPASKTYKTGEDIFAIGTPKSIELGQTLNKGIISGFRTYEGNKMIQTDAAVNGGNSGGALVNKSGQFIGVVNAKIFGVGVEGIGFAIPAELIQQELNISY